jgi:hypothetical protein
LTKTLAAANPIPSVPPVITAVLPSSFLSIVFPCSYRVVRNFRTLPHLSFVMSFQVPSFSCSEGIRTLGDDAHIAKPGELPTKALVRVDATRKACLTNLDCAQDCQFAANVA